MSKIQDIPIVVVGDRFTESTFDTPTNSVVLALLNEIEAKLDALLGDGEESLSLIHI